MIPFFGLDPAIRKIIYTTNAIESLNRVIRKSINVSDRRGGDQADLPGHPQLREGWPKRSGMVCGP